MKETRFGKHGRFLATWIDYTINTLLEDRRAEYKTRFLEELKTYSFEKRKKGEPENSGIVRELDGIDELDVTNPIHLARFVKEGYHLNYQKDSTRRKHESVLKELEDKVF